jgi:hypothetical protein
MPRALLDTLEERVIEVICAAEQHLSASECDIKWHNYSHTIQKIRATGPVWVTSMWVYESMWSVLGKLATKKDTPEITCIVH